MALSALTNNAILTDIGFAQGKVGLAFSLNGTSSHARIPASPALDMEQQKGLTLSAWIKPADVNGFHPILEWNSSNTPPAGIGCQLPWRGKPIPRGNWRA